MLQISQIEKPRCSATIDQIRLRRAMNLPVEFQKSGSSGRQSDIQLEVRVLIRKVSFQISSQFPESARWSCVHAFDRQALQIGYRVVRIEDLAVEELFLTTGFGCGNIRRGY